MYWNEKSSSTFSKNKSYLKRQNDSSRLEIAKKKIKVCNKIEKSQFLEKMTLQARNRKHNRHNRFCAKLLPIKSNLDKVFVDSEEEISQITSKAKRSPTPEPVRKNTDELLKLRNNLELPQTMKPLHTPANPAQICTIGYTKYSRLEENHTNNRGKKEFGTSSCNSSNNCSDNDNVFETPCGMKINNVNKLSCTFMEKDTARNDETFKCFTAQHLCNYSLLKFKNNAEANKIVDNLLIAANQFIKCNRLNGNKLGNEIFSPNFKCSMNPTTKNNTKTDRVSVPYHDLANKPQEDVDVLNTAEHSETIVNECMPLNKIIKDVQIEICEKSISDHCSTSLEFSNELCHNNVYKHSMYKEDMKMKIPKKNIITQNDYLYTVSHPPLNLRKESPNKETSNECVLIPKNKPAVINQNSVSNINKGTFCARTSKILHRLKTQDNSCSDYSSKIKSNAQANKRVCKLLKKAKTSMPFNIPDSENAFVNELLTSELKYFMVPIMENKIKSRNEIDTFHDKPNDSLVKVYNFIENHDNFILESKAFNKDVNENNNKSDEKVIESKYFLCSDSEINESCRKMKNIKRNGVCNKDITRNVFENNIFSSNISLDSNEVLITNPNVSDINLPNNNYNITGIKIKDEVKYCVTNTENPDSTIEVKDINKNSSVMVDNNINILRNADEGAVSKIMDNDFNLPVITIENKHNQITNESSATRNNLYYCSPSINIEGDNFKNDETFQCQNTQYYSCIYNLTTPKSNAQVNINVTKLLSIAKTFMFYNDLNEGNSLINELNSSKSKCTMKPRPINNIKSNKISASICTPSNWAFDKDLNEFDLEVGQTIMPPNYISLDVELNTHKDISTNIVTYANVPKNIQKITDPEITNNFKSNNNNSPLTRDDVDEIGLKVSEKGTTLNSNFCDDVERIDKIKDKIHVNGSKLHKKYKNTKKRNSKSINSTIATKRKTNSTVENKIDFIDIDSIVSENRCLINMIKNAKSDLDAVGDYTIDSPVIGRKQYIASDTKKCHIIDVDNIIYENKTIIDIYNKQKNFGNIKS